MTKIYGEADANPKALAGLKIAVIGYGSQGRGQSLNLRDSGYDVTVAIRPGGPSWKQAIEEGWKPVEPAEAVKGADVVAMLVPDMAAPKVYREAVAPNLKPGALLMFSHGFNVLYGQIQPADNVDVAMVAPKSPGSLVRRQFEGGRGVPALLAIHKDVTGKAFERTLAYAHGLGSARAGVLETTFAEETETDLFGEQAVLCGGVSELIVAGWETLVDAGYSPEIAYFECLNELKLIVDLIYEGGLARMHQFVSETAKYGDLSRGARVIDAHVRESMKKILAEVRSGAFAKEWIAEDAAGRPNYNSLLKQDVEHPIEKVGAQLRSRMAWLQEKGKKAVSA
ncbi:MAG TPA: ketol-acid reductoisomerase [Candidatus Dormibacteraeota bacterium]|nr:ketol-acid reductoisomerase [Candidatus Dormibacteraeota bacterium]